MPVSGIAVLPGCAMCARACASAGAHGGGAHRRPATLADALENIQKPCVLYTGVCDAVGRVGAAEGGWGSNTRGLPHACLGGVEPAKGVEPVPVAVVNATLGRGVSGAGRRAGGHT